MWKSIVARVLIMPELFRRPSVNGPDIVRRSDVYDAVDYNRRSFDGLVLPDLEAPHLLQMRDILRGNLRESAVPPAAVVSVIRQPCVCRRMQKFFGIDFLGLRACSNKQHPKDHT